MSANLITCPGCGAEIPLSEALQEQFRHENQARLQAIAAEAKQKPRADFAVEKQFLEGPLAEDDVGAGRRNRPSSNCARKDRRSKPAPASSTSRPRAASMTRSSAWPSSRT
jgi:hypothetical protein